jgi:hypothetical protein
MIIDFDVGEDCLEIIVIERSIDDKTVTYQEEMRRDEKRRKEREEMRRDEKEGKRRDEKEGKR